MLQEHQLKMVANLKINKREIPAEIKAVKGKTFRNYFISVDKVMTMTFYPKKDKASPPHNAPRGGVDVHYDTRKAQFFIKVKDHAENSDHLRSTRNCSKTGMASVCVSCSIEYSSSER
jgi:hypothetical protein